MQTISMHLAESAIGRVILHCAAMVSDHAFKWHWQGIARELKHV